jgi:hypothetical protein
VSDATSHRAATIKRLAQEQWEQDGQPDDVGIASLYRASAEWLYKLGVRPKDGKK